MSASLVGALAAATAAIALLLAAALPDAAPPRLSLSHPDEDELTDAGWRGGLPRWEAIRAVITITVGLVAIATGIPAAATILAALAPSVWVRLRASAARDRARAALGPLVGATEGALRSGASLPEALRRSVDAADDKLASRPVAEALRAFDLGAGLDAALLASAGSARDASARLALGTIALGVAERLPRERLADLLAVVVDRLSFDARLGDEVRARAAGVRQQQILLAALVPLIAVYLALTMPALAVTLSSDLGRFVLTPAALALEIGGIVLGRRVVREALG